MTSRVRPAPSPYAGDLLTHASSWWKDCARRAAVELAQRGTDFTSEDLTEMGVEDPDNSARWGSLFSALQREELITLVGYRASTKKSRNGGVVRIWRGTAKAKAVAA